MGIGQSAVLFPGTAVGRHQKHSHDGTQIDALHTSNAFVEQS